MLAGDDDFIDLVETGAGPVLLFLPGSYSTVAAWRPVQRLLRPGLRLVTTSLRGYGKSTETRTPHDAGMRHQIDLVEKVVAHVGEPVHLVGHSFGATVALAAALAARFPVASLSLFEANPINLIQEPCGNALFESTRRLSEQFQAAVAAGESDAAKRIIDFWGGSGAFAAMPPGVQAYCRETAPVNVLDWQSAFGFALSAHDCSLLKVPALIVRGALANEAMKAITSVLERSLPRARTAVVEGAGHFLISSHPEACARLLSSFLDDIL